MKKLPISRSINLTRPQLNLKYMLGFVLVVVMLTAGLAFGKKFHAYLARMTTKARGKIEESGMLPGE